jgi:hypothetical protein
MSRIELSDSMMTIVLKMVKGNPGATNVLMSMIKDGAKIDPQSALGGIGGVLALDTYGIYGPRIWMLYSDVCEKDLTKTIALLRAVQLGLLDESVLMHGIDNRGQGLDVPALLAKVKEQLPEFGKE